MYLIRNEILDDNCTIPILQNIHGKSKTFEGNSILINELKNGNIIIDGTLESNNEIRIDTY